MERKAIKVWSADRKLRYGVVAESFQDFIEKGAAKLGIKNTSSIKVTLFDETIIDEDYWKTLPNHTRLFFISTPPKTIIIETLSRPTRSLSAR